MENIKPQTAIIRDKITGEEMFRIEFSSQEQIAFMQLTEDEQAEYMQKRIDEILHKVVN